MQRAIHLVMNECVNDTRVLRAAAASSETPADVTILALKRSDVAAQEHRSNFRIQRVALWTQDWPRVLPVQAFKYFELVLRFVWAGLMKRPAIVHAHDLNMLPVGWLIAGLCRARLIYDSHELWSNIHTILAWPKPLRSIALKIESILTRRADRVITVCDSIADELQDRYSTAVRPTIVRNIPDAPTDIPNRARTVGPAGLRATHGLSDNDAVLLFIGGMSRHRGLEILIEALQDVPDHVHLVLVGNGPLKATLEEQVHTARLDARVHFHGVVPPEQLLALASEATVGVVPYEGVTLNQKYCLPNKVFEYIQSGLPLIVSDLPEMRRIVDGYKIGRTFRDQDAADLSRVIQEFLADSEALDAARSGIQTASAELTWPREREQIIGLYRELVA